MPFSRKEISTVPLVNVHVLLNAIRLPSSNSMYKENRRSPESGCRPGGGDSHMKQTGMLVRNFEFNP